MNINDFLQFRGELLAMAYHLGADDENAQDVVQDVYLKLLEIQECEGNLDRIEYKGEPNKAYLYLIVRSKIGDIYRDRERQKKEEAAFIHNVAIRDTMDEVLDKHDIENDIENELKQIHFFPRMVFTAYALDNHSIRSLSEATNIGAQTLRNEINYVKQRIKSKTKR